MGSYHAFPRLLIAKGFHGYCEGDLIESVQQTLGHTHIEIDDVGQVHLLYDNGPFRQSYQNGINAAPFATNPSVVSEVQRFIDTQLTLQSGSRPQFVLFDCRERWRDAHVLVRTCAPKKVRVAILRQERPEAGNKTDDEIAEDMSTRDRYEKPHLQTIYGDETNVIDVFRTRPDGDSRIAQRITGTLVDFRDGNIPSSFGTISIRA